MYRRKPVGILFMFGAAVVGLASASGCATKGYVRSQVADLRQETGRSDAALRADLDQARADGARALAEAGSATDRADSSRLMALGEVGYKEAARYQVYFAFDSAVLDDAAKNCLDEVANLMENHPRYFVELLGFADPTGSEAYNLQLGQRRASAALRYLASRAPDQLARFTTISFGETPPDAEQASWSDDHAHQRQVLLMLVERTPSAKIETLTSR